MKTLHWLTTNPRSYNHIMPSTILGLATADPSGSIAQSKAAEVAKAYGRLTDEQAPD